MGQTVKARTGGRLVAESLEALGAEVAFGVPGIHALAIWDGLRTSPIRTVGLRTELSAGFAADGYARTSGRPAPLLLSTGPGALISLAALMEAASAHVPVVAIASQIPRDLIGAGRGFLHELPDQKASFEPVVKWAARAESAGEIPELLAEAWRRALTPPSGPVFLEIPVDVLAGETDVLPGELDAAPETLPLPDDATLDEAAYLLAERDDAGGLGRRRRAPLGRLGGAARGRGPARRAGGDDVHGQGRLPRGRPAGRRDGAGRAGRPRAPGRGGRRARGRHRARRRDDRAVRARALGPADPRRRRPAPDRRDVRGARARRRREGRPRRAGRAPRGPSARGRVRARRRGEGADRRGAPRVGARPPGDDPRRPPPRRRHHLGHDHPGLLGSGALPRLRAAHVPLPARLRDARLRVAGRARRLARRARPPGARRRRRRRLQLRARRARGRAPALARREAPARRRRRLRDPARVPARPVRRDDRRRPRRARLPRAGRGVRRPGRLRGGRTASPRRWRPPSPRRARPSSTSPPSWRCGRDRLERRRPPLPPRPGAVPPGREPGGAEGGLRARRDREAELERGPRGPLPGRRGGRRRRARARVDLPGRGVLRPARERRRLARDDARADRPGPRDPGAHRHGGPRLPPAGRRGRPDDPDLRALRNHQRRRGRQRRRGAEPRLPPRRRRPRGCCARARRAPGLAVRPEQPDRRSRHARGVGAAPGRRPRPLRGRRGRGLRRVRGSGGSPRPGARRRGRPPRRRHAHVLQDLRARGAPSRLRDRRRAPRRDDRRRPGALQRQPRRPGRRAREPGAHGADRRPPAGQRGRAGSGSRSASARPARRRTPRRRTSSSPTSAWTISP